MKCPTATPTARCRQTVERVLGNGVIVEIEANRKRFDGLYRGTLVGLKRDIRQIDQPGFLLGDDIADLAS